MTGLSPAMLPPNARLAAAGQVLERERTFSDRPPGAAFWYENSNGLAEIAVNQGRADRDLDLAIGIPVEIFFLNEGGPRRPQRRSRPAIRPATRPQLLETLQDSE
jgi:hypothetical protein